MATLGDGSGRAGSTGALGDFSVAGIVTRMTEDAPTDPDWGYAGAPPIGTTVWQATRSGDTWTPHTLWVRGSDGWYGKLMNWDVEP